MSSQPEQKTTAQPAHTPTRRHRIAKTCALTTALFLTACSNLTLVREHKLVCPLDEEPWQRDTLYFGLSRPTGGVVSEAEWQAFHDDTLLAAFPTGFTELSARGRWLGGRGGEYEDSRVIIVLHSFGSVSEQAVARVTRVYAERFDQESVLRERSAVCVKF